MVSLLLDLLALTPRWTMSPGLSDSRLRCFYWGCGGRFGQSKELSLQVFQASKREAAQSAFLFTFKRSTRSRSRSSRRSRGCTVPLLLVYAAVPVCWEEIVLMLLLLLLLAAEGSELPNALAAGRGHRTAVSHARVPAADNNGRPSLPAGPYNPSSCWEARARILHAFNEFLCALTHEKLYYSLQLENNGQIW